MANYCCSFRNPSGLTAGTYTVEADLISGQGYNTEPGSWTMRLYPYDPNATNLNIYEIANFTGTPDFIVDGWVPWAVGSVSQYGDYRFCIIAYIDGYGNLVFPTLVKSTTVTSNNIIYYIATTKMTDYKDGLYYYDSDWSPLTIEKQSSSVWKTDQGLFFGGNTQMSIGMTTFFQAVYGLTITKQSSVLPLSTDAVNPLKELSLEPAGEVLKTGSGHMKSMTVFSK